MKITHTTKEVISSIDISIDNLGEASVLLTELEYVNRRTPFMTWVCKIGTTPPLILPNLDNLLEQLRSKVNSLKKE